MARMARAVFPGIPHHITQRGNRRQTVFFNSGDYQYYIDLLSHYCGLWNVDIWAYCLMPNHVHLIAVPIEKTALGRAIGETHRRYTRAINFRENWRGYLWQGRYASFPMDEHYLHRAVRYVELNPVKAKLVDAPEKWKWSSAAAHLMGTSDDLVNVEPMLKRVDNWSAYLSEDSDRYDGLIQLHERTGRPLGSDTFINELEKISGRPLRPQKPGPKGRQQ